MTLVSISPLEIVIIIVLSIALIVYTILAIYKAKHPKKKKEDDE